MTDPMELVGRLELWAAQPGDELITEVAAALRSLVDSREGMKEDLYQAVLVAYRRGATEWARLNYPQWIDAISAGREVSPPKQEGGA